MSEILDFKQAISLSAKLGQGKKWIRIATLTDKCAGLIMLSNGWNVHNSTPILIAFSFGDNRYDADLDFRVKLIVGSTYVFKKARVIYLKGATKADAYIEVWQDLAEESSFRVDCNPVIGVNPCLQIGSISEGYTAKEFELTESGGVKRCTLFAVRQKGVQHERYYGTLKQGAKYHPAKCYALPGSNEEFRRVQAVGMLHYGRNDHLCKSSGRMGGLVEIRNSRSVGSRHCRNTEVVSSYARRSGAQFQRHDLGALEKSLNGVVGKEVAA